MTEEISKANDVWKIIHNRPVSRNALDPGSADAILLRVGGFIYAKALSWNREMEYGLAS